MAELQAALLASQAEAERYRLLLQHSGEVSWMADCASLRLTWLSPAAERQFGYTLDSAQALAAGLLRQLPARLERHAGGDPSRVRLLREIELPHADGRLLPVEIESTLILDEHGVAVSVVG